MPTNPAPDIHDILNAADFAAVRALLNLDFTAPGPIGSVTPNTIAATTLGANGAVTFTAAVASTTTGTGTLVVTGGVGVSGAVNAGGRILQGTTSGGIELDATINRVLNFYNSAGPNISARIIGDSTGSGGPSRWLIGSTGTLEWNSAVSITNGAIDLILQRDAANTLAQRNGTAAQALRVYNTWTDASNYERGGMAWVGNYLYIGTNISGVAQSAGTGTQRDVIVSSAGGAVYLDGQTRSFRSASGTEHWKMNSSGHFLAGTNNTYDIGASGATSPRTIHYGTSIVCGSTKVLGAQAAAVADATDATTVITQLNDLLAKLRTHGLIAT